jgi:hypothetical protein
MSKRMTKGELQESLGAFNPVGHAVVALPSDDAAAQAREKLLDAGFADADILVYTSGELFPDLNNMMRDASGAAGFGYEINLMRRYMRLASEGAGWLVVYAPDEEQVTRIRDIAVGAGATSAVHYGRLASEDLV